MSFAATSMRGARLNARFAVKGIHSSSSDGWRFESAELMDSVDVMTRGSLIEDRGSWVDARWCEFAAGTNSSEYGCERQAQGECGDERRAGRPGRGPAPARGDSAAKARRRALEHVSPHGGARHRGDRTVRCGGARAQRRWKAPPPQASQAIVVASLCGCHDSPSNSAHESATMARGAQWTVRQASLGDRSSSAASNRPRSLGRRYSRGERMADVQIQQTPETGSGSGAGWVWALLVLILLAVIAWFVFGGGLHRTTTARIDINTPGAPAGGGSAAGSVGSGSASGTASGTASGGVSTGGSGAGTKKP